MSVISYREALCRAMREEMQRDERVFLMGEEVAEYNGAYKVSKGLLEQFGKRRVWDTPISENGFAGVGIGAAMVGLRPIIEMMTWNFGIQAFDQIFNHAAKMLYMSGGNFSCPIVFRGPNGPAHMLAATHSQNLEPMLCNVPGLKVVSSSCPYDGLGLLKSAIRDNSAVIFLESELSYGITQEVPDEEYLIPLGKGEIKRQGKDVTLVAWNRMVKMCSDAAEILLKEDGIDCEILDPRTLQPLDEALLFSSIARTHRMVVVEEAWDFASVGAQIVDRVQRECFDDLDAPLLRVTQDFVPMPYNERLEAQVLPSVDKVVKAVRDVCYKGKN
jgi:pyruvate/2-oxoglutarate/acetoin dehydrogenase E1 component